MKRKNQKIQIIMLIVISILAIYGISDIYANYSLAEYKNYKESAQAITQLPGTYTSTDGKTITVAEDGTTKYLDTYKLTVTESSTGNTLSGKVGTNKKTAKFYQLNEHTIVSGTVVNYTHNSVSEYLYDYTVFILETTPEPSITGTIEIWRDNQKINSYNTLQDAIDAASSGDTIKLTNNYTATEGTYINKDITIDGNNNTIDISKWLNSLIVLEEKIELTINNLTIDGGATGFQVDYDSITWTNNKIPLVENSDINDEKHVISSIISKGKLNITNTNMNNIYGSEGSVIRVLEGSINIEKSKFNHNRGTSGGAISIGRAFENTETEYPIKKVTIKDSEFTNNYATNGGAIYGYNYEQMEITNSKFITNVLTSGKGGAIYFARSSNAEQKGLGFNQVKIYQSEFVDNWSANDGYAINNEDAELNIEKCTFNDNKGVYGSSSVGVISLEMKRTGAIAKMNIKDSTFKRNFGAVAVIGDHGYNANINFENCYFSENEGSGSVYILASKAIFKKCTFEKEKATISAIEVAGYSTAATYEGLDYLGATVIVEDSNFIDNQSQDIVVYQRSKDNTYNYVEANVIINGEVNGNVSVWDGYNLTINGTLNGDIIPDELTSITDITINGIVNGKIEDNTNKFLTDINYKTDKTTHYSGFDTKYIYLESNKTYTPSEIYLLTRIDNEGYTMELYTDKNYTNPWDYIASGRKSIYVKWVEHTHDYDESFIVENNNIFEQCTHGHLGKKISLSIPIENTYNGKEIPIVVNNELNIENYKLTYYIKENDGWKETNKVPTEVGSYKATLTYNNLEISQEYSILEAPKVEEPIIPEDPNEDIEEDNTNNENIQDDGTSNENPYTSNNVGKIISLSIMLVISISLFTMYIIQNKKIQKNI